MSKQRQNIAQGAEETTTNGLTTMEHSAAGHPDTHHGFCSAKFALIFNVIYNYK